MLCAARPSHLPVAHEPRGPTPDRRNHEQQHPRRSFHARHDDELLTLDDVAEILRTPVNTVRWWRQEGTGPEFFKIGRRLYTTVGDLRTFIRTQRLASQPVLGKPKVV